MWCCWDKAGSAGDGHFLTQCATTMRGIGQIHALPVMELKGQPLPPDLITCSFSKHLRMLQKKKSARNSLQTCRCCNSPYVCSLSCQEAPGVLSTLFQCVFVGFPQVCPLESQDHHAAGTESC